MFVLSWRDGDIPSSALLPGGPRAGTRGTMLLRIVSLAEHHLPDGQIKRLAEAVVNRRMRGRVRADRAHAKHGLPVERAVRGTSWECQCDLRTSLEREQEVAAARRGGPSRLRASAAALSYPTDRTAIVHLTAVVHEHEVGTSLAPLQGEHAAFGEFEH